MAASESRIGENGFHVSSDDHYEMCHFCQTTCLEYSWHKRVKRVDPIPTPVDIQNLEQNFGNVEQILLPVEDGPEFITKKRKTLYRVYIDLLM